MRKAHRYIEVARIVKPQGIKGELKLLPYCSSTDDLARYKSFCIGRQDGTMAEFAVERFRVMAQFGILKLVGIGDRDAAEELRNCEILIRSEQLPKIAAGEFFIQDLIGLQVISEAGDELGILTDVLELPAQHVYQIQKNGKEMLIPAISSVVLNVSLDAGTITVRLPDGLPDLESA